MRPLLKASAAKQALWRAKRSRNRKIRAGSRSEKRGQKGDGSD